MYFWFAGFLAFLWVLLRSGTSPHRLSYPCQQVAFPLASSWFLAVAAFFGGTLLMKWLARVSSIAIVLLAAGIFSISFTDSSTEADSLPIWKVSDPISNLFILDNIPLTPGSLAAGNASVPDAYLVDPAMDTLLQVMESSGKYFYHTTVQTGMLKTDHVVVIKANLQWRENLGTNTDRIKGLIWKILQHPDGFDGEILVCDNDQGVRDFNECNNSEDTDQSIVDVVNTLFSKGYPVYLLAWDEFMYSVVNEYSDGDMTDGFPYNPTSKVSYPKFRSPEGTYISLKHGIWNTESSTYDRSKLFIVNFSVNKAHGYTNATLGIKNWVGVMTVAFDEERYGGRNSMHSNYIFGSHQLTVKIMEQTFPDLTIIDGTWTAPINNYTLSALNRIRTDMLVASTDPIAASWYAAKYILTPVAASPVYTDPDGSSGYGPILRGWSDYLTNAGFNLTYDSSKISIFGRESLVSIMVSSITVHGTGGSTTITNDKGTLQMSDTVFPSDAVDKSVTWSVINGTGKASISSSGLLQAISNGTVLVVATANDGSGVQGTLEITISNQAIPVSSIAVYGEGGSTSIEEEGGTLQMYAGVLPADAADNTVTWIVINESGQATISSGGLLQGDSNGVVMVVATANDGSEVQGSLEISISNQSVPVSSIILSGEGSSKLISQPDGTLQIYASVSPGYATDKTVTWSVVNDIGQAAITSGGLVQALAIGTVTVVASANDGSGIQGMLGITITDTLIPVTSIQIQGAGGSNIINSDNGTLQMTASVLPTNATIQTVDWTVNIGSGKASITPDGLLQAIFDGTVTVMATANDGLGVQDSLEINITNQTVLVSSIILSGDSGSTIIEEPGGVLQINAAVLPANASDKTVKWYIINNTGQATITSSGLLHAVSNGTVIVLAVANDGSGVQSGLQINITNQGKKVTSISLTSEGGSTSIDQDGGTLQLYANVLPADADDNSVTWSVNNGTGQASISSDGQVQGLAMGTVTVYATANDGSGTQGSLEVTVNYNQVLVQSISVEGEGGLNAIGEYRGLLQMITNILPANATNRNVSWTVDSLTGEAYIDQNGMLTAISDGTVRVIACAEDEGKIKGTTLIYISGQGTSSMTEIEIPDIEIFHNPDHDILIIRWMNPAEDRSTIRIFNLYGQLVYLNEVSSNSVQVDLSFLETGYYILQVNSHNRKLGSSKIFVF